MTMRMDRKYRKKRPRKTLREIEDIFWSKIRVLGPDDCWLWQKGTNGNGYGVFSSYGKYFLAHRFAYMCSHKIILDSHELVLHHCDVPGCCNPYHLYKGTHKDNARDRETRNRRTYKKLEDYIYYEVPIL